MKRGGGRRYYRPDDVALLRGIRQLLYGEGYTIRGVQRIIREQGIKGVVSAGMPSPTPRDAPVLEEIEDSNEQDATRNRGLLGLLPSLLGDAAREPEPEFAPEDVSPEPPAPRMPAAPRMVPPVPGSSGIPREDLRRLQAALHELAECRRLLDTALRERP